MKKWIVAGLVLLAGVTVASAGWKLASEVTAGGGAKELAVNRTIQTVQIHCITGPVIVNTIVVREGGKKTPFTVARRFNDGEKQNIDLGQSRNVTGLRISDGGRGTYKVFTK